MPTNRRSYGRKSKMSKGRRKTSARPNPRRRSSSKAGRYYVGGTVF